MKKEYALVINLENHFRSFFGLSEHDLDMLTTLLSDLKISYDVYLFLREKRYRSLEWKN